MDGYYIHFVVRDMIKHNAKEDEIVKVIKNYYENLYNIEIIATMKGRAYNRRGIYHYNAWLKMIKDKKVEEYLRSFFKQYGEHY